jgi:murein DD-endopeptidase MepM/ murein hydrolase activator NlpD
MNYNHTELAENRETKLKLESFIKSYNSGGIDDIFLSFSVQMQDLLTIDKTREFFTNLKLKAGKIIKSQFLSSNNSQSLYRVDFEKGVFLVGILVGISVDDRSSISSLQVRLLRYGKPTRLNRNKTKLTLPFKGEWTVIWGGDTKEQNYHIDSMAQKNAFDILINNDGVSHQANGEANEDYYAFGKEIIAPCNGEVVLAVDGIKDNIPGILNPSHTPGNSVVIKTKNNEYLYFAHLKQNSIAVKQGQKVEHGQLLGFCGNSGNSSQPHLHFHLQDLQDFSFATSIKCYFDNILVNGELRIDYSPVQNDNISNKAK